MFDFAQKIFKDQSQTITSAALILALTSLISRVLGFFRDRLLAGSFGASDALDAYYAAFRVPDLVYNLLVMGALSAGFIPVFVSLWQKEKTEGEASDPWRFVSGVFNLLAVGLIVLTVVGWLAAPSFVKFITPGFAGEKLAQTISLTRILFLSPLILGLSAVMGGVLQARRRFLIYSLAPIFYNMGIIGGIMFLAPSFGVYGVAAGVIIGALLHFLIQCPAFYGLGFRYKMVFGWADESVRRLIRLTGPRILTLAVSQINFLALTAIGSGLVAGSLTIFNLTYNIWTFPLGILAASLATAAFPQLSQAIAAGNRQGFREIFSATCRQILFLILPVSALFWVLRTPLVQVILGTGKFGLADVLSTGEALKFLILGLFAEAVNLLLVRGFFALEDTKTPFWVGLFSSILRIGGAWWLAGSLGVAGLALGYASGGIINMVWLWFLLSRKAAGLAGKEIFASALKIILASLVAGLASWGCLLFGGGWFNLSTLAGALILGFLAGGWGLVVYLLSVWLLRSPELKIFWQGLKNRLPFKSVMPDKELIEH
jgi:putative peptidoglycan lipid II flippase